MWETREVIKICKAIDYHALFIDSLYCLISKEKIHGFEYQ